MRAQSIGLIAGSLALALVAGCARTSPCDGISGACIGAHIGGTAKGLMQLSIAIDQPTAETVLTPNPPAAIKLPARVALALPAGTTGAVHVSIDGLDGNLAPIAHDEKTVNLPASGRIDVDFTLGGSGGGGGGGGGGGEGPDMATGVVITASDQTAFELEPLSATFSATDVIATDLELTATGVPATATFTATGASATLTWTPTATEGGVDYPITLTATSASDPTRTASQMIVVHAKNTIDPALNAFGISPDQLVYNPVGDVDGDGLVDFAYCTITAGANAPPVYAVNLVWGDKSGLPTARPYPAARTKTISFTAPAGSNDGASASSESTNCVGGDTDGDGKSDILLGDIFYTPPGGGAQTGHHVLFYGQARADTTAPTVVDMTGGAGDLIGGNTPVVGDWNGDGLMDFAVVQSNLPSPGASAQAHIYIWRGQFPRASGSSAGFQVSEAYPCGGLQLLGFGAATGVNGPGGKKAHPLVWYDGSVAADGTFPVASCVATAGGLRVYSAGIQINGFINESLPGTNAPPMAICDVDADGIDDLLVLNRATSTDPWNTSVVYGTSANAWGSPVNLAAKTTATTITHFAVRQACWPSAYGPSKYVVGDPGNLTSLGFLNPGTLYFYTTNATGVPVLSKMEGNFDGSATTFNGFGAVLQNVGDLDGDGKPDLTVAYQPGTSMPDNAFLLYGR